MATQIIPVRPQIEALPNNSAVQGFNKLLVFRASDFAIVTTAGDTAEFALAIPAKSRIKDALLDLRVPFQNTSDAANDSTTVTVGDSASATLFTSAVQINLNGTEVGVANATGNMPKAYNAADTFRVTFTPKTGTALSALNKGELRVYAHIVVDGEIG
jgi:hypothetical protein